MKKRKDIEDVLDEYGDLSEEEKTRMRKIRAETQKYESLTEQESIEMKKRVRVTMNHRRVYVGG